ISALTGKREHQPQPVEPRAMLDDLAAMTRPTLGTGVVLDTHIGDLPPRVMLDPGALQDALLNLILNARDAMRGQGRINVDIRAAGRWLEISVTDTGPGFSDEALARATEPFFTTKGSRGTGLGLSMAYDQIKLSGGTLRIVNVASGG
ncbi:sensor histidine kinase, partial [Paracoccus sp. (in: a-proteobacteria)]